MSRYRVKGNTKWLGGTCGDVISSQGELEQLYLAENQDTCLESPTYIPLLSSQPLDNEEDLVSYN